MSQTAGSRTNILLESGTNELEVITLYLQWLDPASSASTQTSYGINAAKVRELVAMPSKLTEVPDSHPSVRGVFMLRDRTILLIDLCHWFGYQPDLSPEAKAKWVVVVTEINGKLFSFISHGVDKVHRISWNQIMPPPEVVANDSSLTGMCLVNDRIIQMIDFEKICADIDPSMAMDYVTHAVKDKAEAGQEDKFVVIADDSAMIRDQITQTLTRAGYKVKAFPDGQSAWDFLELTMGSGEVDSRILGIISDIEMPRMDGHHLCMKIKQQPAFAKVPVMLFSSLINDTARHKGEKVGADDQITKPELGTLVERLQGCLRKLGAAA
ncbi:chemotaxis protein [Desulfurivibrio alkaliphilus]|uniref:Response regulator receiver modulated CheW protein n=1 Tax=Desulfurivibrio alkaliphilus (strain DSM 19089 / UNIQEM U267 / AHT2) TaxID=589865 RepID=D6Z1F5_DESAT|nr:chemotaxis protein [Desulfurivibrio alkaliphilus]ADH85410.1 response regulator receiver modulated CheW protein [Desulfurivibrio alkaliphilus AHT 2]